MSDENVVKQPAIWVLAGPNGAGKSSVIGEFLRSRGGDYYNPDETAGRIVETNPDVRLQEASALAWREGHVQLRRAIGERYDYFFETTLGGRTITKTLETAIGQGMAVRIWFIALRSADLHVQRVAERVRYGGHDIPEQLVRARYDNSRRNLIRLLPKLTELKVFDNSFQATMQKGQAPRPEVLLHFREGRILAPDNLSGTPEWAKPIVAAAIKASIPQPAK